jgi:eukaryotic translation initiation factor 2C
MLSTPQINYAGERKPPVNDASWYLVDGQTHQKFKSISRTERQLHVLRHPNCLVDPNVAQDNLVKQLNKHGLTRVRSGDSYIVPKRSTLAEEMKTWCENADYYKDDCTLVLLKEPSLDEYSSIKREADFAGHHTLCVVGRKLISKEIKDKRGAIKLSDNGVASNISLKANLKFAGENHQLESNKLDAFLGLERRKNTVILGADVTHPSKGGKGASPSIACVVGSNDSNFMNYPGSMRLQTGGQEVSFLCK